MSKIIATLLILFGLWTNLMAGMITSCHDVGECCPELVESCQQSPDKPQCGDDHCSSKDAADDASESGSSDNVGGNDHHHHCTGSHSGLIALPALGQNSLPTLSSVGDLNAAYHASIPEAPTFSLEQPPRG